MSSLNLNTATLCGHLTADVELKQTQSGVPVCTFTLAINRPYNKDGKQETDFISCQAWRSTAEFIAKYFKKGSSLCIMGAIQTRTWTDNQGNKRYATEVVAEKAMFVDGKSDSQGNDSQSQGKYNPYEANASQKQNFEALRDDDVPF